MMPNAVVNIFEAEGWKWGGRFGGYGKLGRTLARLGDSHIDIEH
jgi:hypothetical protein